MIKVLSSKKKKKISSGLEELLLIQVKAYRLVVPEREYRFHSTRRWRFDFAWPNVKLAVEVEGATWTNGRHTRGAGYESDCEKYNTATLAGWKVLRFTSSMVKSGMAIQIIKQALEDK